MQVTGHSWQEMIDRLDVTSSVHGGIQSLIAGIFRGEGNIKGYINTSIYPWAFPYLIRAGSNGTLFVDFGSATPFSVSAMVVKVHSQHAIEGRVEFDFDCALNNLVAGAVYIRSA